MGAIEPRFFTNLCRALGCEQWVDHQYDDGAVDAMRAAFATAFACNRFRSFLRVFFISSSAPVACASLNAFSRFSVFFCSLRSLFFRLFCMLFCMLFFTSKLYVFVRSY